MRRHSSRAFTLCALVLCLAACDGDPETSVDSGSPNVDSGSPDLDSGSPNVDSGSPNVDEDAGADPTCVSVTGAGGEPWLDLRLVGRQFDAYEDARIRVIVGSAGRVGVAHAQIHDGSFEMLLPGTMNFDLYNEVGLYIDDNSNDSCDDGERQWGYVSGRVMDHLLLEVTPDTLCVINGGPQVGAGCRAWNPQPEPCYVDGPVDIRMSLPCSQ